MLGVFSSFRRCCSDQGVRELGKVARDEAMERSGGSPIRDNYLEQTNKGNSHL